MVALPLLAIAPYLLVERRRLLRQWQLWLGLGLGWLPVLLWLSASVHSYGLPVVAGLWTKLLFLSSSDSFAPGPLYYVWNIPANTAPWILPALAGWPLLWRAPLERSQRLLLLLYPLLLLLLLSAFRTKTPYYGLQLSPFIAMAAAVGLQSWSQVPGGWLRRLDGLIASIGAVLVLGAGLLLWPAGTVRGALAAAGGLPSWVALAAAAAGLGLSWLAVPWQATPRRRLAAVLLGPWLALVLLHQAGLFSDRTPALRRALEGPAAQAELRQGPIAAAAGQPLSGDDHALLISLALATPQTPSQLLQPSAVGEGQKVWIRRSELGDPRTWRVAVEAPALQGWLLAQRRHNTQSPMR
jgi:4-amino-4-deoxy-L-arabinose transferase-like glycosyltransferase